MSFLCTFISITLEKVDENLKFGKKRPHLKTFLRSLEVFFLIFCKSQCTKGEMERLLLNNLGCSKHLSHMIDQLFPPLRFPEYYHNPQKHVWKQQQVCLDDSM